MRRAFLLILCLGLSRCTTCDHSSKGDGAATSSRPSAPLAPRVELRIDRAEGFGDVDVPAQLVSVKGQVATVRSNATYRGRPLDIEVVFTQTGSVDLGQTDPEYKGVPLGQGNVELRSIDGGGDPLLAALSDAYDAGPPRRMKRRIEFPISILGGSVATISDTALETKAFIDDGRPDMRAEFYVNYDPKLGVLQIHEKDEEYRNSVLSALSE